MTKKIILITLVLLAFNIFCGFNIQRVPRWFQAQWDYYSEKFTSSAENYEKASAGETDSVMHYNQGAAEYKNGNYEKSEELYTKATQVDPLFEDAYYNQGNARFRQGNLEGAVESYEKALEIDPEDEDARYNLEFVKKLLEQKTNTSDNADPQEGQQSQNAQSSERDSDESRNQRPEDKMTGQSDDSEEGQEAGESSGGKEQPVDDEYGKGGGGNEETDEDPPQEMKTSKNTSGLSERAVEQLLDALANEERALAGMLEPRQNSEKDEMDDPFGIFNDLWTIPDELDPFARQKRRNRDKDEVDW